MTLPLVSCILATRNRQLFLRQAIKYFLRQTYANKELVIVDDSPESAAALVPDDEAITYIKLDASLTLGTQTESGDRRSFWADHPEAGR